MARPSPLIIACLGVGGLVLGAEVTAIYRSHHRPPATTSETPPEEPSPVVPAPAEIAARPPPPALPPAPPAVAPPPEPAATVPVGWEPERRPQFTSPNIETVIRTADEEVFAKLDIPDATRAAIRKINEEHAQKLHAFRAGDGGVADDVQLNGNHANIVAFKQTRREALQQILGPDTEIRFERAERAATKHFHNQLRAQALGGVSAKAPAPSVQ